MHRLLYTSEARLHESVTDPQAHVAAMSRSFAERNAADGLGGVLIFIDNHFIQVLEGKLDSVEAVFERICCDFRHANVRLIDLVPIDERLFEDWGMACLSSGESTPLNLREDLKEIRFLVGINGREAINQIRDLLERHNGANSHAELSPADVVAEA